MSWRWFMLGFVIVFVGMALVWPMHFYDGHGLRQMRLWQYYVSEIRQAANSSGALGPTSGNLSSTLVVALTHIAISSIGGVVAAGIRWMTHKAPQNSSN